MAAGDKEAFLSRWSRLKQDQAREATQPAAPAAREDKDAQAPALPPVDQLTPESDFSPFMQPKAAQALLRRVALKKLFNDPHFNVPDLNEAYSGDWTGGEPISEELLKTLNQGAHGPAPRRGGRAGEGSGRTGDRHRSSNGHRESNGHRSPGIRGSERGRGAGGRRREAEGSGWDWQARRLRSAAATGPSPSDLETLFLEFYRTENGGPS